MVADGTYHVRARGNNGEDIFRDDADRVAYVDLLTGAKEFLTFQIFAYVLMSNHVIGLDVSKSRAAYAAFVADEA
jgi:REP element-mobilizing transposase RayT